MHVQTGKGTATVRGAIPSCTSALPQSYSHLCHRSSKLASLACSTFLGPCQLALQPLREHLAVSDGIVDLQTTMGEYRLCGPTHMSLNRSRLSTNDAVLDEMAKRPHRIGAMKLGRSVGRLTRMTLNRLCAPAVRQPFKAQHKTLKCRMMLSVLDIAIT